ncbi:MAG: peptidoglycan DD-metalloendopeptidase family protein [bacterium]|nr:peptidoglycan DD-metalloendopeptidase family protein [bacterium]
MRFGIILFFLLFYLFAWAKDSSKELQKKLTTAEKEHSALKQQAQSILKELQRINKEIATSRKKILYLQYEEQKIKSEIDALDIATGETQIQLLQRESLLKSKLALLYEEKITIPDITNSPNSELDNFYASEILKKENKTATALSNQVDTLSSKSTLAKEKFAQLSETMNQLEKEYSKVLQNRNNKASILNAVKTQESEKAKLIEELKSARANLDKLISDKSQKQTTQKLTDILWPVKGRIISKFGTTIDPKIGTQLINKGIDISAPYGTDVIASSNGKVIHEGTFLGYGKIILIDHENGFSSLYAYLSETLVTKNDKVSKGEIIGRVGSSGLIDEPTLHFEIRKAGVAIDPLTTLP